MLIVLLYFLGKDNYRKSFMMFCLYILFFICFYNRGYFNINQKVTFLNVMQGDCTIIQDSFSKKVMLIDTGGKFNYISKILGILIILSAIAIKRKKNKNEKEIEIK